MESQPGKRKSFLGARPQIESGFGPRRQDSSRTPGMLLGRLRLGSRCGLGFSAFLAALHITDPALTLLDFIALLAHKILYFANTIRFGSA
jgi:hypothetical protein